MSSSFHYSTDIEPTVASLSISPEHTMFKQVRASIILKKGFGVEGDAHAGVLVKHRSRVAKDPNQPNLRQVHLIHKELIDELKKQGFILHYGQMGENITTSGIKLLALPRNTILNIGETARIRITGLRNPCGQLDGIQEGLMQAVLDKDADGAIVRKAGIMGIVLDSGKIEVGDIIKLELPIEPFEKLAPV